MISELFSCIDKIGNRVTEQVVRGFGEKRLDIRN